MSCIESHEKSQLENNFVRPPLLCDLSTICVKQRSMNMNDSVALATGSPETQDS